MNFRGKELSDAYQAKRDVEEKEKVRELPFLLASYGQCFLLRWSKC